MNLFKIIVIVFAIIMFIGIFIEEYSTLFVKLSLIIGSLIIVYTSFIKKSKSSGKSSQ
ncbi:hypothetical protein C8N25_11477 [Algoriphagus antarcticus]|jgi:ABC-type transport system involved in Fe-S cluster assembly fused permease/ATPase subunit|uniref:Uncharacterized protein n=1 Tax=Algoriphagus antarcticus TaxID=238540 RepID=A0A3E0DTC6_9BACT|nr:hypothetical protein C8N25_11477 [Algoriphagus antarcticus]